MAKNRDGGGATRGMNSKGKTVKFTPPKGMPQLKPGPAPTAKVGNPTKQTAADKAATAKANKNPQFTGKNVPVVKSSSYSLRGMQGSSSFQPTKGQIAKAAAATAALGAATGFQIVKQQVVSQGTKKLQRELSKEVRTQSNKDIKNMPKAKREEIAYSRATQRETPEEYLEGRASQAELKKKISESMKKTTTTKKAVKKRK